MEFILILAVIFFVAMLATNMEKKSIESTLIINKQKCPPHKWRWQEIIDQDGNRQGERIVCDVCGPLSKSLDGSVE